MKNDKRAPLLHKDKKKEQNVNERGEDANKHNSKDKDKSQKESPKNIPESNDPVGYSENKKVKDGPYEQGD